MSGQGQQIIVIIIYVDAQVTVTAPNYPMAQVNGHSAWMKLSIMKGLT